METIYNHLRLIEKIEYGYAKFECLLCHSECVKKLSIVKIGHTKSCGCLGKSTQFQKERGRKPINYFDNLDDEGVNYWGGFLFGDGSVNANNKLQVCLTTNNNSVEYLKKLSKFMMGGEFVNIYKEKLKCHLQITNEELVKNLTKFGIIPNKTYNSSLKIPNKDMVRHVIRGYFDADGWYTKCLYKGYYSYALGICSYLEQNLIEISRYLPVTVEVKKYNRKNQLYHITVQSKKDIFEIVKFLEPENKEFCFNYKWDRLWNFQKEYENSKEIASTKKN